MKNARLDMVVTEELKASIVKLADESGMSINGYVRNILAEAVKDRVTMRIKREVQSQPSPNHPAG